MSTVQADLGGAEATRIGNATLSDFVRRRRLRAGLTQADLAERAGLSVETVSALERGLRRRLYPSTALFIGEALRLNESERSRLADLSASHVPSDSDLRRAPSQAPTVGAAAPPVPLSSFIGRDADAEAVRTLLQRGTRLLTLTGPGGVGKSRLAVEVARTVSLLLGSRVWHADLSMLRDGSSVAPTVDEVVRAVSGGRVLEEVGAAVGGSHALLVLDGCEAVVAACAELAVTLMTCCPSLAVMVTSRERLGVSGETVWRVKPLAMPVSGAALRVSTNGAETAGAADAVGLFVDRATAADPSFRLTDRNWNVVAEICRRLDGLPLAIEWAAARTRVLAPEQIAARLDKSVRLLRAADRTGPDRHRALGPLLDWSHDLLSEPERLVFRRLSVFTGGWNVDAAELVCAGDGIDSVDILDLVTSLVDKSLVTVDQSAGSVRFGLLNTVRRYAAAKLAESGEQDAVRQRHADVLVGVAEHSVAPTPIDRVPLDGHTSAADRSVARRSRIHRGELDRVP